MEEDEGLGDDGISELIADLGKGEVLGEKMYEFVKKHLNCKVPPTSTYAQFIFILKLLHIKSFSRTSNVAFNVNATVKLLQKGFLEACLPNSFDEAMKYIRSMGLGYEKSMFAKIIMYYFTKRSMSNLMCVHYVVKRIQDGRMQTPTSTFLKRY
jgi:hypothetical protein